MDAPIGFLFFTVGFTLATAVVGAILAARELHWRTRLWEMTKAEAQDWTSGVLRRLRWKTTEESERAMEP